MAHSISLIMLSTLPYRYVELLIDSLSDVVSVIHDPGFDGVETKSQHNNSKSSCTSKVSPICLTEPIPRDDTPTVIPFSISAFNILPDGVW